MKKNISCIWVPYASQQSCICREPIQPDCASVIAVGLAASSHSIYAHWVLPLAQVLARNIKLSMALFLSNWVISLTQMGLNTACSWSCHILLVTADSPHSQWGGKWCQQKVCLWLSLTLSKVSISVRLPLFKVDCVNKDEAMMTEAGILDMPKSGTRAVCVS
jgi:hypothetical protein